MADTLKYCIVSSPIGPLRLLSNGKGLVRIEFPGRHESDGVAARDGVLDQAARELEEYFAGRRHDFEVAVDAGGTGFQQQVWDALRGIPYGEMRSYRDIADSIGNPRAVRAVGAANGRNPVPIIVPCHRVIGSDGKLTGFAGGLETKRRLLALEGSGDLFD
jgi:methylated-DNA-[protein]-cysteine S-methyltransferase